MAKRTNIILYLAVLAALAAAVLPSVTVYADDPGIIGPVNHLGANVLVRVILAALLDGVNPSALGVLLLLCRRDATRRGERTGRSALAYIGGIVAVYVAAGLLLRSVYLNFGPSLPVMLFQIGVAGLLFLSGLNELIAAAKPDGTRFIEAPAAVKSFMVSFTRLLDRGLAFPLGMLIGMLELFATGAIYLSFIQAITFDPTAPLWVLLVMMTIYVTAFLVPIVVAYSYRGLLGSDVTAKKAKGARLAKGIIGTFFMLAALFVAASAIVTIQAIGT